MYFCAYEAVVAFASPTDTSIRAFQPVWAMIGSRFRTHPKGDNKDGAGEEVCRQRWCQSPFVFSHKGGCSSCFVIPAHVKSHHQRILQLNPGSSLCHSFSPHFAFDIILLCAMQRPSREVDSNQSTPNMMVVFSANTSDNDVSCETLWPACHR